MISFFLKRRLDSGYKYIKILSASEKLCFGLFISVINWLTLLARRRMKPFVSWRYWMRVLRLLRNKEIVWLFKNLGSVMNLIGTLF